MFSHGSIKSNDRNLYSTNNKDSWEHTLLLRWVKVNEWGGLPRDSSRKALVSKRAPEWGLRDYLEDYSQPCPMSDHPRYNSLPTERKPVHNIVSWKWEDNYMVLNCLFRLSRTVVEFIYSLTNSRTVILLCYVRFCSFADTLIVFQQGLEYTTLTSNMFETSWKWVKVFPTR